MGFSSPVTPSLTCRCASFALTKLADEVTALPDPWCTVAALVVSGIDGNFDAILPCSPCLRGTLSCNKRKVSKVRTVLIDQQHAHVGVIEAVDRAERYALDISLGFQTTRRPPGARFEGIAQLNGSSQTDAEHFSFLQDIKYLVRRAAAQPLSQMLKKEINTSRLVMRHL